MSYTEAWSGKFKILAIGTEAVLEKMKEYDLEEGKNVTIDRYEDEIEYIECDLGNFEFIKIHDKNSSYYGQFALLQIIDIEQIDDNYHTKYQKLKDDVIMFDTRFHNSGWCLSDSLEEIVLFEINNNKLEYY